MARTRVGKLNRAGAAGVMGTCLNLRPLSETVLSLMGYPVKFNRSNDLNNLKRTWGERSNGIRPTLDQSVSRRR